MTELQIKGIAALTLNQDAYFDLNNDNVVAVQKTFNDAISGDDENLGGPDDKATEEQLFVIKTAPEVDVSQHQTIPLLIGIAQTGMRMWQVTYETNTASILTNLENGEVYIQWPFIVDKRALTRPPSMSDPKPDDLNAGAILRGVRYCDLREVYLDYNWIPSHYAITVIYHDWVSNTELFELKSPGSKAETKVPLARYKELYHTLATNEIVPTSTEAFSFSLPQIVRVNAPIVLGLSLNMTSDEIGLTKEIFIEGKEVLPIAVMLFQQDNDYPVLYNFSIPVEKFSIDGNSGYKASTSIDLIKALKERKLSGEFLAYINIGKNLFGPKRITIGE